MTVWAASWPMKWAWESMRFIEDSEISWKDADLALFFLELCKRLRSSLPCCVSCCLRLARLERMTDVLSLVATRPELLLHTCVLHD